MRCLFCELSLPADSRFCSACGNPSHFRPCEGCDAVNPRDASRCWRCDTALAFEPEAAVLETEVTAAPVGSIFERLPRVGAGLPVPAVRTPQALALPRARRSVGWQRMALPAAMIALLAGAGLSALHEGDLPDAGSTVPLATGTPALISNAPSPETTPPPSPAPVEVPTQVTGPAALAPVPVSAAAQSKPAEPARVATGKPVPAPAAAGKPVSTRPAATKSTQARRAPRAPPPSTLRSSDERLDRVQLPAVAAASGAMLSPPRERTERVPAAPEATARCQEFRATLEPCGPQSMPKGN